MSIYIALMNWTDQGVKNAKDSARRFYIAKQAIEKTGAKIHAVYYTFGKYDIIGIIEDSSAENMARNAIGLASQGNLRIETLPAFTLDEAAKILESLP